MTCDSCSLTWDRKGNVKDIVLCPLHAAAPELLSALEALLNGDVSVSHMKVAYEDARRAVTHAKGGN